MANTEAVIRRLSETIGNLNVELAVANQSLQELRDEYQNQAQEIMALRTDNDDLVARLSQQE